MGFAQAYAQALQGFAACLEVQALSIDQDTVIVPKNGPQQGALPFLCPMNLPSSLSPVRHCLWHSPTPTP